MSEPADKPEPKHPLKPTPPARPVRAAAPIARPSAPTLASPGKLMPARATPPAGTSDALSELAAIAGSTIAPSAASAPSSAATLASLRPSLPVVSEAAAGRRAASNRALLAPSCAVLGVTLPILGLAWFGLERHRVLRDNPLGIALPMLLFAGGAIFLGLLAMMLLSNGKRGVSRPDHASADHARS